MTGRYDGMKESLWGVECEQSEGAGSVGRGGEF